MSRRPSQTDTSDEDHDRLTNWGGWLFRHRTALPVPIGVALLLLPPEKTGTPFFPVGVVLIVAAELVRLWAIRHIGVVSRTRSERLGPLVSNGPFRFVRNPLYLANIGLWLGFALCARLIFVAPAILVTLAFEYHAIVRWEESLMLSRLGAPYEAYLARVPRWIPSFTRRLPGSPGDARFSWGETFFSERGTLIAIGVGSLLLWVKTKL